MSKPLILVCNDDGIFSVGIRTLIEVMSELGEVVVVAPDSPQSGMGHAITIGNTLRLESNDLFPGIVAYECSGTPADCIKLAKHYVLKGRKPDLVVSGINHGSNSSISVLYSGTMSAAIEAALEGLPAIGFSLCDYDSHADFSHVKSYVKQIATEVLTNGIAKGITLNDERFDPYGRRYFWMAGSFENKDAGEDTDEWALANGYVSVVPCSFDLTAHQLLGQLNRDWKFIHE
jgi:5'-nucleotidase